MPVVRTLLTLLPYLDRIVNAMVASLENAGVPVMSSIEGLCTSSDLSNLTIIPLSVSTSSV